LDLKSNGFNLEASRLREKFALSVVWSHCVDDVVSGAASEQVVGSGKRSQVDAHWKRG